MKACSAWKVVIILVLMCTAFAVSSSAQTLTTIYDFCLQYPCTDGASPAGTLVQGHDGNFYGTTSDIGSVGQGTVYKLTSSGTFTVLHSFTGLSDGGVPRPDWSRQATEISTEILKVVDLRHVFKVTAGGTLTPLHVFAGGAQRWMPAIWATGAGERWQLLRDDFYRRRVDDVPICCGTVFKITAAGTVTILHDLLHAIRLP